MIQKFKKLLKEFVAIKSVSTDPEYVQEILRASKWLVSFARKSGLKVKIIKGFDNPIIIARTPKKVGLKTVMIYGHYDVQPGSSFILTEIKRRLYARGVADNKGQILIHLYSIINLLKRESLNYNITFFIEGNEETGSPNLRKFIKKYKKDLKCDCVIISDGELGKNNCPALEASFRGVANFEVILQTAVDDMHSGIFGGVAPNAAEELAKILGSLGQLVDKKKVDPSNIREYERRRGLEPTIEITSFISGYVGVGFRNSIPGRASAKINIRSAPGDNPQTLVKKVQKFILNLAPSYANVIFFGNESSRGMILDLNNDFSKRAEKILRETYKSNPVFKNSGGTLPIVNDFKEILKVPQVMIPLANEDCGMHSASENITIEAIERGLAFSYRFFSKD